MFRHLYSLNIWMDLVDTWLSSFMLYHPDLNFMLKFFVKVM